jgi:hypothetical protein
MKTIYVSRLSEVQTHWTLRILEAHGLGRVDTTPVFVSDVRKTPLTAYRNHTMGEALPNCPVETSRSAVRRQLMYAQASTWRTVVVAKYI